MNDKPNKKNNRIDEIIIYDDGKIKLNINIKDETIWLTQVQMAKLFGCSVDNISLHLKNIYATCELDKNSTSEDFSVIQKEGKREIKRKIKHYNLDVIISVGYRVKSKIATKFRIWATKRLKEFIIKGFTIDDNRLKECAGGNYWKELLERIRDIRSSEKVLYRQVLDLYATSIDYDPKSSESQNFFKIVQNKLHYAVNKHTSAEIIYKRVDAEKEFMGLTNFKGSFPVKSDIYIAKNYLNKDELFRLNRMVSAFFDLAEIKAQEHKVMTMKDWVKELDKFVKLYGKGILEGKGKISKKEAEEKAEKEYRKYQIKTLSPVEKDYLESIKKIEKKVEKKVKKGERK